MLAIKLANGPKRPKFSVLSLSGANLIGLDYNRAVRRVSDREAVVNNFHGMTVEFSNLRLKRIDTHCGRHTSSDEQGCCKKKSHNRYPFGCFYL